MKNHSKNTTSHCKLVQCKWVCMVWQQTLIHQRNAVCALQ